MHKDIYKNFFFELFNLLLTEHWSSYSSINGLDYRKGFSPLITTFCICGANSFSVSVFHYAFLLICLDKLRAFQSIASICSNTITVSDQLGGREDI